MNKKLVSPGPKEPVARLLDLTYGWASAVEDQEGRCGDTVKSDELHGLYQDAAQLTQIADPVAQAQAVRAFVEKQIIPLLIAGTPGWIFAASFKFRPRALREGFFLLCPIRAVTGRTITKGNRPMTLITTLKTRADHEMHHIFALAFGAGIRAWAANETEAVIARNGAATLAEVEIAVRAGLPQLLSHLTPFLPAVLRPCEPMLAVYAAQALDALIAAEYARLVAAVEAETVAQAAKTA